MRVRYFQSPMFTFYDATMLMISLSCLCEYQRSAMLSSLRFRLRIVTGMFSSFPRSLAYIIHVFGLEQRAPIPACSASPPLNSRVRKWDGRRLLLNIIWPQVATQ